MGFVQAVTSCLANYATFSGRASRSEYWYFGLFSALLGFVTGFIEVLTFGPVEGTGPLSMLLTLMLILPSFAVTFRRLHDTDRSGWWLLIALVPLVGALVLLIFYCTRGTPGPNRFG